MKLPPPTESEEDAFVDAWSKVDDHDRLIEAIEDAMAAHRPRLAARLVSLLRDGEGEDRDSVERARRAARMLVIATPSLDGLDQPEWTEFEDAFAEILRRRMRRLRHIRSRRSPRGRGPGRR